MYGKQVKKEIEEEKTEEKEEMEEEVKKKTEKEMEEEVVEYENDLSNINTDVEKKDESDPLRKAYYSKLKELYNEFMKIGIPPKLIKNKPPKRSPLYKKRTKKHLITTVC